MMQAAGMIGITTIAQMLLPRLLGSPQPGNAQQVAGTQGRLPVEAALDQATHDGLRQALVTAPPPVLDSFELQLFRANCPLAAKLCRDRAAQLRAEAQQGAQNAQQAGAMAKTIADTVTKQVEERMNAFKKEMEASLRPVALKNEIKPTPVLPGGAPTTATTPAPQVVKLANGKAVAVPPMTDENGLLQQSAATPGPTFSPGQG